MAVGSIVARILTQYSDKGSKAAAKDVMKLGKSFDKFAKKSARAFGIAAAASAAFAIKVGTDAVQAAIADQKSQSLLANSLRNTVGATDEAIAGTETYITAMQKQFSVVDDDLRPALGALAAATGSVTAAQSLMQTALDVSANSGVDLGTSVKAIIAGTRGQYRALAKLVPGLDAATLATKDYGKILDKVSLLTAGAAATRANTLEYRLAGLRIAFGEILETLGYALLPVMERFATVISTKVLPQLEAFIQANKQELAASFQVAADFATKFLSVAIKFGDWVANNTTTVKVLAGIIAGMFVINGLAAFISGIATISAALVGMRTLATSAGIALGFATGGASAIAGAAAAIGITAAIYGAGKAGYYGGGDTPSATPSPQITNGYLGSMPMGSAIAKNNPVLAGAISGPGSDLQKYLASLGKTMTTTAKASKALLTEKQKELNLKLKELGITTTEQQDAITQNAIIRNAERQKRLSGSATIALGAAGSLSYGQSPSVIVNSPNIVGSQEDLIKTVEQGIETLRRRGGYAGRYSIMAGIL
jgi:hypothetical protein